MASTSGPVYFPTLDKCLDGSRQLISWRTAFVGLTSPATSECLSPPLEQFLSDSEVVHLLGRPYKSFRPRSRETQSSFETKTAAIHATPSSRGDYDIEQLKADALWLSTEADIDEVAALRITVQEWQGRASLQLFEGSADDGKTLENRAFGSSFSQARSTTFQGQPSTRSTAAATFQSTNSRRKRLFRGYLSDRRYLLKVSELLIRAGVSEERPASAQTRSSGRATETSKHGANWVTRIGRTILNARIAAGATTSQGQGFVIECIESLEERVACLDQGSTFFRDEEERFDIEAEWGTNLLVEMTHILQILFDVVNFSEEITSARILISWLNFAAKYGFFEKFEPAFESQGVLVTPFQSLIAILTLTLLKFPLSLQHIARYSNAPVPDGTEGEEPYFFDPTTMENATEVMTIAASECFTLASPVVFAWSIVLQTLRETVSTRRDRQNRDAIESFAEDDTSDTEEGDSSATENGSAWRSRRRPNLPDPSQPPDRFDQALEKITLMSDDEDLVNYLAKSAVNGSRVFEIIATLADKACTPYSSEGHGQFGRSLRSVLLGLVRDSLDKVDYLPEVVNAIICITSGNETFWEVIDRPFGTEGVDPSGIMLLDTIALGPRILEVASGRFPFEKLPLLRLIRSLSNSINFLDSSNNAYFTSLLQSMTSFTQALPVGFQAFDLAHEQEDANHIILSSDLRIFTDQSLQSTASLSDVENYSALVSMRDAPIGDGITIPAETTGRVVLESDSPVVQWNYEFSGLKYLGKLLESSLPNSHIVFNTPKPENDRDTITELVGVFAMLLASTTKADRSTHVDFDTEKLLAEASDGLDRNGDIISVVFEVFENELQHLQFNKDSGTSLDLLINCTQFIVALTSVMPGRVWPLLARSSLLEIEGRGGRLVAIVASAEIVTGHFDFLASCVRLFEALVKDAVDHAVARKCTPRTSKRFQSEDHLGTRVPDKVMSKVLLAYARPMVDVFESSSNWKFAALEQGLDISCRILFIFDSIFKSTYGIDDSTALNRKITSALAPASEYLTDVFLSASPKNLVIESLTRIIDDGFKTPLSTVFVTTAQFWVHRIQVALSFSTTLIFASNLLKLPTSFFERQMLKSASHLVRLYASHASYRFPVIALLDAIIESAGSWDEETPSLLGHLGPETGKVFLSVLSRLDAPLDDEELEIAIWNLIASSISNRQQSFAIYLLAGSAPRESIRRFEKSRSSPPRNERPLLSLALASLENLSDMSQRKALAILEFIALAEDHWSWALTDLAKSPRFFRSLLAFVDSVDVKNTSYDISQQISDCYKMRIAACIAEILAMSFHQARQIGDTTLAKSSLPFIRFYLDHAVAAPSYNASLHANLRRNFEEKFPGCTLSNLKRTDLQQRQLGRGYFYDTELGKSMLGFDRSWAGIRGPGLGQEVERANVNLSVVQAQVSLLHSWKLLAIEFGMTLPHEVGLQKSLAKVVSDCLMANATSNLPENFFDSLIRVRSDFALVLMQRLVEVNSIGAEVKALLKTTWSAIRSSPPNFELALAGGDAAHYRSLLKILFLALRFHTDIGSPRSHPPSTPLAGQQPSLKPGKGPGSSSETLEIIVEILDLILRRSFRDLAAAVHEQPETSSPEDFALLTAILQTCLQIPGVERSYSHIRDLIADSATARVATTLFSWSEQLSVSTNGQAAGDPVYGELAILLLVELSSIPLVAEQLAMEGLLGHLSTSNLTAFFRQGIRPLDGRSQRLYSIWTRGFLPLCLNLLLAIGPPIAAEISSFLNQFSAQLGISWRTLDGKVTPSADDPTAGSCTLAAVSEAHSLALIDRILERFRTAGASTGVLASEIPKLEGWDANAVKENVGSWLQGRRLLRERIVPVGNRENTMLKAKAGSGSIAGGCESQLEEKIIGELNAVAGLLGE